MRKSRTAVFAVAIAMFMTSFCSFSFAADDITIEKPVANSTYYIGEKMPVDFTCEDTVFNQEILAELYNAKNTYCVYGRSPFGENPCTFNTPESTSRMAEGTYTFTVYLMPDSHFGDNPNSQEDVYPIYIKKLKAPTKLKAKAGKKKVTITYKKAAGATQYEIYRSTKKSKNYKKIKTTSKLKYVDKKVKKGKKYYYKVRSKRSAGYGTVYSSYTKKVKTKKVKR